MRTRTSPRNQEILWRQLGGDSPRTCTPQAEPELLLLTDEEIDALHISGGQKGVLKRRAAKDRLRAKVRAVLAAELDSAGCGGEGEE